MQQEFLKNIEQLPPLNITLQELQKLNNNDTVGLKSLIEIIEKDPIETITLINLSKKVLNKNIDTVKTAIIQLGITKTFALLLNNNIISSYNIDLSPYGIDDKKFQHISILQSVLAKKYFELNKKTKEEIDEIFFSALVQEIGRLIISNEVINQNLKEEFFEDILSSNNIEEIEEAYFELNSLEVTEEILKKWKLNNTIINNIHSSINTNTENLSEAAKLLNVIRTIVPLNKPLSDDSITIGLNQARSFGLDINKLKDTILFVKSNY